ncbi:hypothetical protein PMAYCL1PPCAC_09922, partial [Pristionchus mayeri]
QVSVNGQCMTLSTPGNDCVNSLQCIDQSACTSNKCTCTTSGAKVIRGYCLVPAFGCNEEQTKVGTTCVNYAIPGNPCQESVQCLGGSRCVSSRCSCPQGTTFMSDYCIPSNGNNGNCLQGQVSVNGQCMTLS